MLRSLQVLALSLVNGFAWAIDNPDPPTTTSTTWEIYGLVVAVLVIGFVWVFLKQKKEEREREQRRGGAAPRN